MTDTRFCAHGLFFLFITGLLCLISSIAHAQPRVEKGVLDARQFDLATQQLPLNGSWIWYDNQLLSPSDLSTGHGEYVGFPKVWNDTRTSTSGLGYATYAVTVLLPEAPDSLALNMPDAYTSYQLWANGKVIAKNGTVGKTKETSQPHWEVKVISFHRPGDTLRLVLQVSNFDHHKGGIKNQITLGESNRISSQFKLASISTLIECGALCAMFLIFLILFFVQDRKRIILYFALLCLTWSVRSVFSNDYIFSSFFPDFAWAPLVRIEYLTLYFTMIWCTLFLSRLFTNEENKIAKYLLVAVNCIFTALTVLTSPLAFTQWLNIYLIVAGALILYAATIIFRALVNERTGSSFLTICILLNMLLFAYDIFTYQGFFAYSPMVLSFGYIFLYILMAFALLFHLNIITGKPEQATILRYDDLYKDDMYKVK